MIKSSLKINDKYHLVVIYTEKTSEKAVLDRLPSEWANVVKAHLKAKKIISNAVCYSNECHA